MKNKLFNFLASQSEGIVKIIIGMLILAYGFEKNSLYIIIGLVPLLAGVFDICVAAPLSGLSITGSKLRRNPKKKYENRSNKRISTSRV